MFLSTHQLKTVRNVDLSERTRNTPNRQSLERRATRIKPPRNAKHTSFSRIPIRPRPAFRPQTPVVSRRVTDPDPHFVGSNRIESNRNETRRRYANTTTQRTNIHASDESIHDHTYLYNRIARVRVLNAVDIVTESARAWCVAQ